MLIRNGRGPWREPHGSGYADEAALQQILLEHPDLVPGIKNSAIAVAEFQSGVGPADIVILDEDGSITVVECKLASNRQMRREVLGQVLDYASRLWRMPIETFESAWIRADKQAASPFAQLDDADGRIRSTVQANLDKGRFDLVLAVDSINEDLRRMVEYLNTVTEASTAVVLVEFVRLYDGDLEILMPQEFGREIAEQAKPLERRREWTVEEFVDWCREHDPEAVDRVLHFVEALRANGFEVLGGRASTPSLNCLLRIPGLGKKYPIAMYTYETNRASVEIRFSDFKNHGRELLDDFAAMACSIPAVPLTLEQLRAAEYRKRPSINFVDFSLDNLDSLASGIAAIARGASIELSEMLDK